MVKRVFTQEDIYRKYQPTLRADGRYVVRVQTAKDPDTGKSTYRSFYATTQSEVLHNVRDFIVEEIQRGQAITETEELLSTEMERWLQTKKYYSVRPSSYDRLEETFKYQILPNIPESKKTKDVTRVDCVSIIHAVRDKGYSYSTVKKTHSLLKEFFAYEVEEEHLQKSPMLNVKMEGQKSIKNRQDNLREARDALRKKDNKFFTDDERQLANSPLAMNDGMNMRLYTDAEVERIIDVVQNGYYIIWTNKNGTVVRQGPCYLRQGEAFLFILNTGIRKGEALALRYSDIDLEQGTMSINHSQYVSKKRDYQGNFIGGIEIREGAPKTAESKSTVPLSDEAIRLLRKLHAQESPEYQGHIINEEGKPLTPRALQKRFDNLVRQAQVPNRGIHALRHTFGSKVYEYSNGDGKLVSRLLRHTDVSFTERTYVHLSEKYEREAIRKFKF